MAFKITLTKPQGASSVTGMLLVEMMVALAIGALLVLVLCALSLYSSYSFLSLANYVDLDRFNRNAMDTITKEIRQANKVTAFTTNSITFEDYDGLPLTYTYSPGAKTLTRSKNGGSNLVMTYCDSLDFTIAQRNPVAGSYDVYPVATAGTAKVVNVTWKCSHTILGRVANTENVQTARIVIRKQGT
jgi:Tfp pilus assembly protein PilW